MKDEIGNKIILSIVTSTYNRADLLKQNINAMLKCKDDRVEFIIGDNASTDNTAEYMGTISDDRVRKFYNDQNYGFENFWLLSFHAKGKYFVFVNDRDCINYKEINILINNLCSLSNPDLISNEKISYKKGYYKWKKAADIYFQSRHPGTLIYRTAFCRKVLEQQVIFRHLEKEETGKANNYLVFQLLQNIKNIYVTQRYIIHQPANRERISKVRKEYYVKPYFSLEYRMDEFDDWLKKAKEYPVNDRTRQILLAIMKDSLRTVTYEYYQSMNIPGFARRNYYENHSASEWFMNGIVFTKYILEKKQLDNYGIKLKYITYSFYNILVTYSKIIF